MKNKFAKIALTLVIALALLVFYGFSLQQDAQDAQAAVIGYQTVTLSDGDSGYTTTTYSSAALAGSFGTAQLHISGSVSGTGNITVTPQFSNQPVDCGSVTNWFDAVTYGLYDQQAVTALSTTSTTSTLASSTSTTTTATTTSTFMTTSTLTAVSSGLAETSITAQLVVSGGTTGGRQLPVLGRCMRIKMAGSSRFTPTAYVRLVNEQ